MPTEVYLPTKKPIWDSGSAIWKQIELHLLQQITEQKYKPGHQIPTEMALAAFYSVSRHTVRRAISQLVDMGVVRVEHGRGAFVQENILEYPVTLRTRFSQIVSQRHRLPDKKLISCKIIPASPDALTHLQLPKNARIIELIAVSEVNDMPVAVAQSMLPYHRFQGIEEVFKRTKSITEAFKAYDIYDYTRKFTRITAQMPNLTMSNLLNQPRNKPILVAECLDIDAEETPIDYGFTSFSSERVQLTFENS